jgi:ankyrin repeat protein
VVRLVLEKGAEVEEIALHRTASAGREAMVRPLLENGAEVNAKTDSEWTALYRVSSARHEAVARLLLHFLLRADSSGLYIGTLV